MGIVYTGAQAQLKAEDGTIVEMTGCSVDRNFDVTEYKPCGQVTTADLSIAGVTVTLSCRRAVILPAASNDSVAKGFTPGSATVGTGNIDTMTFATKDYTVIDIPSGKTIGTVIGCQIRSEGIVQVDSRTLAGANLNWIARDWVPASQGA
jgi:hypothetical protein